MYIVQEDLKNLMVLMYPPKHRLILIFFDNKTTIIPPLFFEIRFVTNFIKKVELFSSFFANQGTVIDDSSSLLSDFCKVVELFGPMFCILI